MKSGKQYKAWAIVIAVLLITLLPMLYGNVIAKKGGILDDTLLNLEDPFYLMDKEVKALSSRGLNTGDVVMFVIPMDKGVTGESLAYVKGFTDEVKAAFPEYGVLSLSIVPNYRDTGKEIDNRPYINNDVLALMSSSPSYTNEWKEQVKRDSGVYGVLVGRDFDYAAVSVLLPSGYDEVGVFRRTVEFLEGRKIPAWQWYLKTNIQPAEKFKGVMPAGWVVARGLMDAALIADILKLSSIGLVIVGAAFFFSLISFRQALIATSIVLICFIWVRGGLGLLQFMGIPLYERVYFLLVYTAVIVSGISFAERKFSAYNDVRAENPDLSRHEAWLKTSSVNELIIVTAVISVLNFATLYQIQIRGILEVGVLSALGILFLLALVLWFLPALHTIIGGEVKNRPGVWSDSIGHKWNKVLKSIIRFFHNRLDPHPDKPFQYKQTACLYTGITLLFLITATGLVVMDYVPWRKDNFKFLEIKTRPLEYIKDTVVYKASLLLNRPSSYGFDRLSVAVMPKGAAEGSAAVSDPEFMKRTMEFKRAVAKISGVREVTSVYDTVKLISKESYKLDMPDNRRQIHDALQTIDWDLGQGIKDQLWFESGITLFVSTAMEDTNEWTELLNEIISMGNEKFPDLRILPFGKLAVYPQADRYIREGKPINVLTSQWIVIIICAFWVAWRNRKKQSQYRMSGWRAGLVINMPFVFASSAIVIVMIAFRVPLDQATACVTALAINAAVDFGLYIAADYQTALLNGGDRRSALEYAMVGRGKVVVVDIVLNILCFAPLITSSFIPVARLGWVMIVMLIACGIGALLIMPALLPWCVQERKTGG
ncbi:MAG: hypothetical protein EPN22_12840 [Nitrospirae bacterium]|nr:MAG: hypothetical protein EPN22_12840 [Nitrospirota bacterium]